MPNSTPTAQELYEAHRFEDALPFLKTLDLTQGAHPFRRIDMKTATAKLHCALPATTLWAYDGLFPNPVIEVRRNSHVSIEWANRLEGIVPVQAMKSAEGDADNPSQNDAGGRASDGTGDVPKDPLFDKVSELKAFTVVHLHGGRTEPDSDGWTENVIPFGGSKISHYNTTLPTHQHAPTLWFHDHAMGVTRLNVYAGLAGMWLVRDASDKAILDALHRAHTPLPHWHGDAPLEIPLVLCDRNLQTENGEPNSPLLGQLLHKTNDGPDFDATTKSWADRGPMEFFGPFNTVNGVIWPHCNLKPRPYRLRVVNASNARTYGLVLARVTKNDDGSEHLEPVMEPKVLRQIGSDGGLFAGPVELPSRDGKSGSSFRCLTLAPAERADLLLDLSSYPQNTKLRWINTAVAPFDGNFTFEPHDDPPYFVELGIPDPKARVPFPDVMEFRVHGAKGSALKLDQPLSNYEGPPTHAEMEQQERDGQALPHNHRFLVLAEQEDPSDDPPPGVSNADWKRTTVLTLREMAMVGFVDDIPAGHEGDGFPLVPAAREVGETDIPFFLFAEPTESSEVKHHLCRYKTMAAMFHDKINYEVKFGGREIWNILNLTGDVHPIHLHLVQFQWMSRENIYAMPDLFPPDTEPGPLVTYTDPTKAKPPSLARTDENEKGWKDTIRANPGELLKIVALFDGFAGRYMVHCHVLEHEDHEMMRPFIVLPPEVIELMAGMSGMPGMGGAH